MNEEMAVSVGDMVRDRKSGFVGQVVSMHVSKAESWVIAARRGELGQPWDHGLITLDDVELVADPTPAESSITETVIVGQDKPAKPKPAENIVIDLKVSDEGKALLDKLQLAAENAKAVGLTSGKAKPSGLPLHEKDAIKQALLDAAKQGPLTYNTAEQLIEQFRQVDAA